MALLKVTESGYTMNINNLLVIIIITLLMVIIVLVKKKLQSLVSMNKFFKWVCNYRQKLSYTIINL